RILPLRSETKTGSGALATMSSAAKAVSRILGVGSVKSLGAIRGVSKEGLQSGAVARLRAYRGGDEDPAADRAKRPPPSSSPRERPWIEFPRWPPPTKKSPRGF